MIHVLDAKFRRTVRKDGRICGEIGVVTDDPQTPNAIVWLASAGGGRYEMVGFAENDARTEIDWYDNSMHQAFVERPDRFEASGGEEAARRERESFTEQVLACGTIRDDLAGKLFE